jgi:N-acetylmuramoyl-L-alanine amidase
LPVCLLVLAFPALLHSGPTTPVRLSDLSKRHGLSAPKTVAENTVVRGSNTSLLFGRDSRKLLFNNTLIWMHFPLASRNGPVTVANADAESIITPLLTVSTRTNAPALIVIDPGHGGRDTGASSPLGIREERIVLDLARRVRRRLRASDLPVKLTRKWSSTLSLSERTDKAAKWNADIFLSIHLNYAANTNAAGIETYVLTHPHCPSTGAVNTRTAVRRGNKHDSDNMLLAYHVHRQVLTNTLAPDRGIRRARFEVLCNAPCPAVLLECGFLSNGNDENKLLTEEYRYSIAEVIAQGIHSYIRAVSQETSSPAPNAAQQERN